MTAAPERPYSPAVAARFPAPSVHYTTPAFQNGRDTFTGHEELAAFMAALAAQPGGPQRLVLGRSQQGQAIEAWRFASGSARPERPERPVVLLIGQQHGDEPAGSEALLALAQQLMPPAPPAPADKKPHSTSLAPLLQHIDVIVLPRANPDGAEYGQRLAMDGQDINRDHLLLRTPEARALAQLVRDFSPVVVVDSHEHTVVGRYLEKFKAVQRFDLLLQYAMTANLPLELGRASEDWFRQPLLQALAAEELTSEWYYTNPTTPGDLRLSMGGAQPDTARNVNGLKNAISILLETRGVGIGRLHFERRVHTQVVALRSLLASAAQRAGELGALQRRVQDQISASACLGQVVVLAAQTPLTREVLMLDPVSGADVPVAVQWQSSLELRPLVQRPRPCGYWLEETASDSVLRLQALGLRVQRLSQAVEATLEHWVETARIDAPRPDVRGPLQEAQPARLVQVATESRQQALPAGSWWLPLDQPLALLAVVALEPDSPSSYFANRLLRGLDSAARVMKALPAPSPGK